MRFLARVCAPSSAASATGAAAAASDVVPSSPASPPSEATSAQMRLSDSPPAPRSTASSLSSSDPSDGTHPVSPPAAAWLDEDASECSTALGEVEFYLNHKSDVGSSYSDTRIAELLLDAVFPLPADLAHLIVAYVGPPFRFVPLEEGHQRVKLSCGGLMSGPALDEHTGWRFARTEPTLHLGNVYRLGLEFVRHDFGYLVLSAGLIDAKFKETRLARDKAQLRRSSQEWCLMLSGQGTVDLGSSGSTVLFKKPRGAFGPTDLPNHTLHYIFDLRDPKACTMRLMSTGPFATGQQVVTGVGPTDPGEMPDEFCFAMSMFNVNTTLCICYFHQAM